MNIVQVAYGSPEYELTKALRQRVLRDPLGLVLSDKDVEGEDRQMHIAALEDNNILGSVILKPLSRDSAKLRQMAVAPEAQSRGVGKTLVLFLENLARSNNFKIIELHARVTARVFYEKLGYEAEGEEFIDVLLPHIAMTKRL